MDFEILTFFHIPLRKPFGASIAMKTVFCLKIHIHFTSCRKRSRVCIVMKFEVLGLAQTFHRAPQDPVRASLFPLSATPKTSKTLPGKLQSDSWKTSIFTCRPSCGNENHRFATVRNVKSTLNFHGFLTFLWILNPRKNKENQKYHFRTGISNVLSSWAPPLHTLFHWNLERNSLRTHLRKTCFSRNIPKTFEIATFRPPRSNITTSRSFAFGKTTSLLNTYEKTSKSMTSQKTI